MCCFLSTSVPCPYVLQCFHIQSIHFAFLGDNAPFKSPSDGLISILEALKWSCWSGWCIDCIHTNYTVPFSLLHIGATITLKKYGHENMSRKSFNMQLCKSLHNVNAKQSMVNGMKKKNAMKQFFFIVINFVNYKYTTGTAFLIYLHFFNKMLARNLVLSIYD